SLHTECDLVAIDFVKYPYPPLDRPIATTGRVAIASLRDLGVMKLAAIARRGLRRDFWDLFEILQREGMSLSELGASYVERFGVAESDLYHVLKALTYFHQPEADPVLPAGLSPARWRAIKAFFARDAPKLIASI